MNLETPLWGESRIHGKLLRLRFEVARRSERSHMPQTDSAMRKGRASKKRSPLRISLNAQGQLPRIEA